MAREANPSRRFRFKLLREDGTDLGLLTTREPNWTTGQQIQGEGAILDVVRTVAAEPDDDVHGYLIVRSRIPDS